MSLHFDRRNFLKQAAVAGIGASALRPGIPAWRRRPEP